MSFPTNEQELADFVNNILDTDARLNRVSKATDENLPNTIAARGGAGELNCTSLTVRDSSGKGFELSTEHGLKPLPPTDELPVEL